MKKLLCKIKGHSFKTVKKGHFQLEEYACSRCQQKYTTDGYGQIVRLTRYWEENNMLFEKYFSKSAAS